MHCEIWLHKKECEWKYECGKIKSTSDCDAHQMENKTNENWIRNEKCSVDGVVDSLKWQKKNKKDDKNCTNRKRKYFNMKCYYWNES